MRPLLLCPAGGRSPLALHPPCPSAAVRYETHQEAEAHYEAHPLPEKVGGEPAGPSSLSTQPHAMGRSRVRSTRSLEYSHSLATIYSSKPGALLATQPTLDLLEVWTGVITSQRVAALESTPAKLTAIWRLLSTMGAEAAPHLRDKAETKMHLHTSGALALRCSLVQGAIRHLGAQQLEVVKRRLEERRDDAMRGGMHGTEYDAAAMLRIEQIEPAEASAAGVAYIQLEGSGGADTHVIPLWPAVYWCLRCADLPAALRLMKLAEKQAAAKVVWADLLRVVETLAATTPTADRTAADTDELAWQMEAARVEYWKLEPECDEHLRLVYSAMVAPEPKIALKELLASRELDIEDWLWHRLSMIYSQLISNPSHTPSTDSLFELQKLVYETWGEAYFNATKATPLLFASVLFHTCQFERALAFLYRTQQFADEAVHIALALQDAGLICVPPEEVSHADGNFLEETRPSQPQLMLPVMLEQHLVQWAAEDGVTALQYLWLLRGSTAYKERAAVRILVVANGTDALLQPIEFVPPQAKFRIVTLAARQMHEDRGLTTQAARLLFAASCFTQLAKLLVEVLSSSLVAPGGAPLAAAPEPAAVARTAQLRSEATSFLTHWRGTDAAAAAAQGGALTLVIYISDIVDAATAWREQRAAGRGEGALASLLERVAQLPPQLLPNTPTEVEAAKAELHTHPIAVQRLMPLLLLHTMEATHAKFVSIKTSFAGGAAPGAGATPMAGAGGAGRELQVLRERGEALVAYGGGVGTWGLNDDLDPIAMPLGSVQHLAGWLAEMS